MSCWTYINGVIRVSPAGRTQEEKTYILNTILKHLPNVTGSEKDMEIYVNQEYGHSESSSCDEYGDNTDNLIDRYGNRSNNGWLRIQGHYLLTIHASLRDREFNETYREFINWLCRLSKRIDVEDVLVRICDYNKETIIQESNSSCFSKMYEWPSWCKESNGEPAWWEHLMWDRMKDDMYPLLLCYKYYNDKTTDEEVERRRKFYGRE